MLFMNEYDIESAFRMFNDNPILGPACQTLDNLRVWANNHSDGWAYWPKPCRAAKQLQELLSSVDRFQYQGLSEVTAEDVKKAYRPIKAFLTRQGVPHHEVIVNPLAWRYVEDESEYETLMNGDEVPVVGIDYIVDFNCDAMVPV